MKKDPAPSVPDVDLHPVRRPSDYAEQRAAHPLCGLDQHHDIVLELADAQHPEAVRSQQSVGQPTTVASHQAPLLFLGRPRQRVAGRP